MLRLTEYMFGDCFDYVYVVYGEGFDSMKCALKDVHNFIEGNYGCKYSWKSKPYMVRGIHTCTLTKVDLVSIRDMYLIFRYDGLILVGFISGGLNDKRIQNLKHYATCGYWTQSVVDVIYKWDLKGRL